MIETDDILAALDRPEQLEATYRAQPDAFARALQAACAMRPDSIVLRVWQQRLFFDTPAELPRAPVPGLPLVVGLCLVLGLAVKLPDYSAVDPQWWYPRFAIPLVVLALVGYFLWKPGARELRPWVLASAAAAFAYVAFLPPWPNAVYPYGWRVPDSALMAFIHLPLFAACLAGMSFAGSRWREIEPRMDFLRYGGELVVLTTLILLGGIVLSGLTVTLFKLIKVDIADWYARWVAVFGSCASPVVGTWLYESVFGRRVALARVLAQVFSPLFLIVVALYLATLLALGKSPFQDREFLIVFNGLLLLVLGLTVFSLSERETRAAVGTQDHVNVALIGITLAIDAVALSAILFRLGTFGLTPNRAVVLGSNLLICVHLVRLLRCYLAILRGRSGFAPMASAIAGYLPVYAAWSAFVVFLVPAVFGYR